jgi:hypothetical protein
MSRIKRSRSRTSELLAILVVCFADVSWGQVPAAPPTQATASLADSLQRARTGATQLHIFYVHGMGISTSKRNAGTQNFEVSEPFRKSICKVMGCSTDEFEGRSYANEGAFAPDAAPPPLSYFGEDVWKRNSNDWRAAAPFVNHYRLVGNSGTTIYVHEVNWWPLIFAAKCRQILAKEAALVDLDTKHFETCAAKTVEDSNHPNRFASYAWISKNDVQQRQQPWPNPAALNRSLKRNILDWGFADALLAVGPLQQYIVEGIREVVLASVNLAENQEYVVVSHSLGSYLMFSALDLESGPQPVASSNWQDRFEKVLSQTSHAYFMANQVRLLELADLDNTKNGSLITHLEHWSRLRAQAHQDPPRIVAWSDPDDLLTWELPDPDQSKANGTNVNNRPADNATRWFWILESPEKAHVNYEENKHVIRAMVPKSNAHQTKQESGTNAGESSTPSESK